MQIYKITNLLNGKIYVGKDKHDNENYYGSGLIIKQSIKKYGKEHFKKKIIETCLSEKEMGEREVFWINELNCLAPEGYNISRKSWGGDIISRHPNRREIIEKIRKSNTGKKRTPEFCELMREIGSSIDPEIRKEAGKKGAETRKKRIKEKGYTQKELKNYENNAKRLTEFNKTQEARERVSKQFKGKKKKPFSKEHKTNIGKASKGRKIPGKKVNIEGIKYETLHAASKELNISLSTLRNRLLSNSKKFINWSYNE